MEKATVRDIKGKIRKRRRAKGLSREDMAEQLHKHLNAYAAWENPNDENRLCLQEFLKIAEILDVPPQYLLPVSGATLQALEDAQKLTKFLEGVRDPLIEHVERLNKRLSNYTQ